MLRNFFPDEESKLALADFIDNVSDVFDIMSSRVIFSKVPLKSALRVSLEKQTQILLQLFQNMDTMTFDERKIPFQDGIKISITCALQLQGVLANDYGIKYLMVSRMVQDFLEGI